jgi:CBS domain-containing protein
MQPVATVREHMDTHVPSVRPEMTILEATRFLVKHRVTGAPVIDGAGKLVGILTERDCLKILTAGGENESRSPVAQFMSNDVATIPPDVDVAYAAGVFLRNTFRRLIVVEGGRVVGAITRFDILRYIATRWA